MIGDNLDITDFLVITDITDFSCFITFFDMFEDEIGLADLIIRCEVPSFGAPGSLIFVVVAS